MKAIKVHRLYDGSLNPPVEQATVVFDETGIKDIITPSDQARFTSYGISCEDCTDWVMMPGFVDAHVHLMLPGDGSLPDNPLEVHSLGEVQIRAYVNAMDALKAGVTTMRDAGAALGIAKAVRDYFNSGENIGPDILVCGMPITSTGGHCHFMGGEADGVAEIYKVIRQQQKTGADYIKLIATSGNSFGVAKGNTFQPEEMEAAVREAHRLQLKITMHAALFNGLKKSVYSGTDGIEHCQFVDNGAVVKDKALAEEICKRGIWPCHTLSVYTSILPALRDKPKELWTEFEKEEYERERINLEIRPAQLAFQLEQGVRTVGGSDSGWRFTSFKSGMALNCEMDALAGMDATEIIHSSTALSAECLGLNDRLGMVRPGLQADLLLLSEDPGQNLELFKSAFRKVVRVYKKGTQISH